MIFSSLQYLIFLPIVVFLYWRTTGGARLALVVAASYFFYMSWVPAYAVLLFTLTCINWLIGMAIEHTRDWKPLWKRALLTGGLLVNLGSLFYYKYTNFLLSNLSNAFNWMHGRMPVFSSYVPAWDAPVLKIMLPLGISFFVFEFVHYIVDIYRGEKPLRSWLEFAAFAAFFPSQIAGPIKRFQDFIPQLRDPMLPGNSYLNEGLTLIIKGLFKKIAIADLFGSVVYAGYATNGGLSCADALILAIGFSIQLYCDFSGYTDMGRGSALLMGIRLPENFKLPYLSYDLIGYRRSWHISLGLWFKDYVYVPLAGSRGGRLATMRNLFLTMVISGLWHGAAWSFVIWGALHGIGLIINREWRDLVSRVKALQAASETWVVKGLAMLVTIAFVTSAHVVFRAPDLAHALNVFAGLLNIHGQCTLGLSIVKSGVLVFLSVYMAVWVICEAAGKSNLSLSWLRMPDGGFVFPARLASWTAAVILMIAARPVEACPFVYFQF